MKKERSLLRDILEIVISVTIITFILLKFIIMPCEVDGTSMYPTLHDEDRCYSFIVTRTFGIDRFDICVISTQRDDKERLLVKRVIGMPGETVEYKDNKLYINGEYIQESFLSDSVITSDFKVTLADDEYYCLGDNREVSKDSRYYGPFKGEQIKATNIFVLYPFSNFGVK